MAVKVVVGGELVVRTDALPPRALELVKGALSFPNEDRLTAEREQIPGWWSLPESIDLWRVEKRRSGEVLIMPRGFASQLVAGMRSLGQEIEWEDRRVSVYAEQGYLRPFPLRDYQLDAVVDLMRSEQGFFHAPAGSGKTVCLLGLTAHMGLTTLVIVDKLNLATQWVRRAGEFLGLEPDEVGFIGQNEWREAPLTIALRQTLWSRIDELDATKWFEHWGATYLDEGHHVVAETLAAVSSRCLSRVMIGASATPMRTETQGKIVAAVIGPVIHRTEKLVLRERGILVKPSVKRVKTGFSADFWPTHTAQAGRPCQKPGCKKTVQHTHRNNWQSVLKKLTENEVRNAVIASQIDGGHIHLIPSRQLKHLDAMRAAIEAAGWQGPIFYIRGEENARKESDEIVRQIEASHEAVILSTVADEALDIPPIDRVHLAFPIRGEGVLEQLVGRGERTWPDKQGCTVMDYYDEGCIALTSQAEARSNWYRQEGLHLEGFGREERSEISEPALRFSSGTFSSFSDRWPIDVVHPLGDGEIHVPTREHLFQAMKTMDVEAFDYIMDAPTAAEAKRRGRAVTLRDGWDQISFGVMRSIIIDQCEQHPELEAELRATGERKIIEDRPDPIWGVGSDGQGQNLLGKAWMDVRADLNGHP